MEYKVKIKDEINFSDVEKAQINCYKWTEGYYPKAYAQLIFVKDKGFALRMTAFESNPKAIYKNYNDPVYKDSCLEFFVRFNENKPEYMNFEMNSNGAFLSGIRRTRHDKTPIDKLAPLPKVVASKKADSWSVDAFFDLDFIEKLFSKRDFREGDTFKGNFYKCGDETEIPHYGMWSPVENESPDFHRPEFFGTFILTK